MHPAYRPLTVLEEGGLADLLPASHQATDPTATALQAARDILLAELHPDLLDPVAPAAERDPAVLRVLRAAIGSHTERGGPLAGLPTDDASLLRLFHDTIGWGPAQPYLDDERVQEVKIIGDRIMVQEEGADLRSRLNDSVRRARRWIGHWFWPRGWRFPSTVAGPKTPCRWRMAHVCTLPFRPVLLMIRR
ncbi:hypothetical protein [Chloroflexus aurantiacus]|uniref:hypothetical protein n=1 Tax=Chloroflexus aurantiacus TaxID=1108 RepID=UPI0000458D49|nr:hypothetical protein [Chloroflexus aurantiacus]